MLGLIQYVRAYIRTAITSDRGATMVEYALMVALIAIVAILAVTALGTGVSETFQDIADRIPEVEGG